MRSNDEYVQVQRSYILSERNAAAEQSGVDFLAFPPINIGEIYKKIFDLRKVISQSEILFDLKQLHQLSVGL